MLRHNKEDDEDALVVVDACGFGNRGLPVECGVCACGGACACLMDGIHDEKEARLRTLTDGMLGDARTLQDWPIRFCFSQTYDFITNILFSLS